MICELTEQSYLDILPISMGGSGKQKSLALLGDRLLDLKLYENFLLNGEEREGLMTQKRSMLVSNENLSRCANDLLIPKLMSRKDYLTLSTHEKGTLLEAYLGVLYVQELFHITPELNKQIQICLSKLQSYLNETKEIIEGDSVLFVKSQYKPPPDRKKAKSTLLEVLQKRGVDKASSFFTTWSIEQPNFPPFVSKFEPNFDLVYCNLPDPGPVIGEPCISKKDAEESVAAKVLQFFRDRELMVFAPEKSHLINPNALNPPTLIEQIEALQKKLMSSSPIHDLPTYTQIEIIPGTTITLVTGGSIDDILNKSYQDYLNFINDNNNNNNNNNENNRKLIELPESLPLPEILKNQKKRLIDPKEWSLCSNDQNITSNTSQNVSLSTTSVSISTSQNYKTILDGPYTKRSRPNNYSESNNGNSNGNYSEEGEVDENEEEYQKLTLEEREQENRRVRENLISLRQARQLAEAKKVENYRKYATRKRGDRDFYD